MTGAIHHYRAALRLEPDYPGGVDLLRIPSCYLKYHLSHSEPGTTPSPPSHCSRGNSLTNIQVSHRGPRDHQASAGLKFTFLMLRSVSPGRSAVSPSSKLAVVQGGRGEVVVVTPVTFRHSRNPLTRSRSLSLVPHFCPDILNDQMTQDLTLHHHCAAVACLLLGTLYKYFPLTLQLQTDNCQHPPQSYHCREPQTSSYVETDTASLSPRSVFVNLRKYF